MATKHGLGRGLGELIKNGTVTEPPAASGTVILKVPIEKIRKSPLQPRRVFDESALAELTESIRERGVLQPLLVRSVGADYELIAGERRYRASQAAGIREIPVIVMNAADRDALELALIENLQREDLNVLDEAEGYQALCDKFGLTQEQVATRVGKARASVTNSLRLLALPMEIKQFLASGQLSAGHAKLLSGLEIEPEQLLFARQTVKENLSVRNLEKLIQKSRRVPRKPRASRDDIPSAHLAYLSDRLHKHFGTSVRITSSRTLSDGKKAHGSVEIDYYSNEDLDRILGLAGLMDE
jgi:ParB family transcriptional regulator, chromosome partitioning protein